MCDQIAENIEIQLATGFSTLHNSKSKLKFLPIFHFNIQVRLVSFLFPKKKLKNNFFDDLLTKKGNSI